MEIERNIDLLLSIYEKQFPDKSNVSYVQIITNILVCLYKQKKSNENPQLQENVAIEKLLKQYNPNIMILSNNDNIKIIDLCKSIDISKEPNIIGNIINYIYKKKDYFLSKQLTKYYTNNELIQFMLKMCKPKNEKIANLCSGSGGFVNNIINNYNSDINNIDCYENNEDVLLWNVLNNYFKINKVISTFKNDIVYDNCIKHDYDLILCDFPLGVRNIINANCNDRIKQLKIRGTKVEPLILQLIMTSLNKNGRACIIVPNTLLYNDSKQHVQTRDYLLNNFNVKKVVSVNLQFQHLHDYTTSILYFENTGKTESVQFTRLDYNNNIMTETEISTIPFERISDCMYNLSHNIYQNMTKVNVDNKKTVKLKDLGQFISSESIIDTMSLNGHYLVFPNYMDIKEPKNITINRNDYNLDKNSYSFITNHDILQTQVVLQKYLNYYIEQIINPSLEIFTSGKLNKLELDKLYNINIPIISVETQEAIIKYYDTNYKIIHKNIDQIYSFKSLQYQTILIYKNILTNKLKIKDICSIDCNPNTTNTIMIQRNSKTAGSVSLSNEFTQESTNIYFLNNVNNNVDNKFLYYILKNKEQELNILANYTMTTNLPRNKLEDFEINILNKEYQKIIVEECDEYESNINMLLETNKRLSLKNMIREFNL